MADLTIVAADVIAENASVATGVLGEAASAGDVLYIKSADSKLYKAQSDTAAKADADGIALASGGAGQTIPYTPSGTLTPGGVVAVGTVYVVSQNAGKIAPVGDLDPGEYVTIVGMGKTTSTVQLLIVPGAVAKAGS